MGLDVTAYGQLALHCKCRTQEDAFEVLNQSETNYSTDWLRANPGKSYEDWEAAASNKVEPWNPPCLVCVDPQPDVRFSVQFGFNVIPYWVYTYKTAFSFRVGSYTYYDEWRRVLALLATGRSMQEVWKTPLAERGTVPFYYLLDFPDCQGAIGADCSAKLYADFVDNEKPIRELLSGESVIQLGDKFPIISQVLHTRKDHRWFWRVYRGWKRAFNIARRNGVVVLY